MNSFLKLKHWQVFVVLMAIPLLVMFFATSALKGMYAPRIVSLVSITLQFGWLFPTAYALQRKVLLHADNDRLFFKASIIVISVFTVVSVVNLLGFNNSRYFTALMMPSAICVMYLAYFAAKYLRVAELQRNVVFDDFLGEFFMILFFPVGIWYIQPRFNAVAVRNVQE